ncbi:SGNH/GDSL hydrolase family protein [Stigmatella sp. ncwal1]|uniref:SGNH/GDSL hydrolase family protein n=1 Tax=Stigmatella ashevillensis TaxID=2995309 RepID=A0ABT5DG35_9BACT|nr:SGNH/GDSL hydrolase family protein [Stigmatella ashevillena]MDC0712534.1 SGNH/GDSL hydrolase family protein [Stigmatella ashevillena]
MTRVLFIGNSYTSVNDLPGMLASLVKHGMPGTAFLTETLAPGGATLRSHLRQGVAPQRIREGRWQYVVLQEQSQLGGMHIDGVAFLGQPEALFFPAARQLAAQASSAGARPLFYMTWSRREDLPAQRLLTDAYARIASELGAVLAPAGVAWERVRRERPELELYAEDGSHPAPAGTYLSACVLFSSIFRQPCQATPVPSVPLTGDLVRYLQRVGSEVALAEPLPELAAPLPPPPVLPGLPPGEPLEPARLAGPWRGTLNLYPKAQGMSPALLNLALEAQGMGVSGRARLTMRSQSAEAPISLRVEADAVSFSIRDPSFLEASVAFRGVLRDGALQGVASAEDPQGGQWYGSWTARPETP